MLDHALSYLDRGWSVIPATEVNADGVCSCGQARCKSAGKHPRIAWTQYQQRRPTAEAVRAWWTRWPNANVAVVTGAVSGLVVLDIDPRHGGDESLIDLGTLPPTLTSLTGGGGQHLFYAHPGTPIANGANLLPGIDLRGDGGYVIAPPSSHASGRQYSWDVSTEDLPPAPLPEAVTRHMGGFRRGLAAGAEHRAAFDLDALLESGVAEGRRNDTMAQLAGYFIGEGKDRNEALILCSGVNATAFRPPLDPAEVRQTVDSIWRRHQRRAEAEQAVAASVVAALAGHVDPDELPAEERLTIAAGIWREMGVEGVLSWRLFLSEPPLYMLQTSRGEIALGDDLLDQGRLRKRMHVRLGILLQRLKTPEWEARANALHRLALIQEVEGKSSDETVEDWVEAYLDEFPPKVWSMDMRRSAFSSGPISTEDGAVWIRPPHLRNYIEAAFGEKVILPQMRRYLKQVGWEPGHLATARGTQRGWRRHGDNHNGPI